MSLLTIVFITGCGETELECYTQHIVGTWEEPAIDLISSAQWPVEEIWGLTPLRSGIKLDYRIFPRTDRLVLNADGSYLIQATDVVTTVEGGIERQLAGFWGLRAKCHLEERGTYELVDPSETFGHTVYIKFFPEGVDVQVEDAYLEKGGEDRVYLDVEPMNEWLNNVGVYGDTMMSSGVFWERDSSPYSGGDEIRLRGTWLDDEVSLHCR